MTQETNAYQTTVSDYLHGLVTDSADVEDFLNSLTRLAVHHLSGPDERVLCGVTLLRDKRAGTVASSSERAQQMDEIQYDYADGPCLQASREQAVVSVPDLAQEQRWPIYAKDVLERGIRSVLAVPFSLETGAKAALNLYAEEPGKFDAEAISLAEDYARQASKALRLSVRLGRHQDTEANLAAALESRTTINLAVGIIMGQSRCSQEEAFSLLRSASSTRNIKLREVAAGIVGATGGKPVGTHFDQ